MTLKILPPKHTFFFIQTQGSYLLSGVSLHSLTQESDVHKAKMKFHPPSMSSFTHKLYQTFCCHFIHTCIRRDHQELRTQLEAARAAHSPPLQGILQLVQSSPRHGQLTTGVQQVSRHRGHGSVLQWPWVVRCRFDSLLTVPKDSKIAFAIGKWGDSL